MSSRPFLRLVLIASAFLGALSSAQPLPFPVQDPPAPEESGEKKPDGPGQEEKKEDKKDEKKSESDKPEAESKSSAKKSDKDKKDDKKDKDALKRPKLAPVEGTTLLIRAKRLLTRPGEELANADVLVRDGAIVGVGKGLVAPEGTRTLEADVVCAGFLDPWSSVGIEEESIGTFDATADSLTIEALDAYRDPHLRRQALRGGVTSARVQAAGRARVGGLGAVVRLDFGVDVATTPKPEPEAAPKPAASESGASQPGADKKEKGDKEKDKKDGGKSDSKAEAPAAPVHHAPVLAPRHGNAVLNEAASLSASIGIPRQGNPDPFDRIGEVDRLGAALDAGRRLNEQRITFAEDLAKWEKEIAEKEKQLEKDFKKAKKDREKEQKDAEEKAKEFKEKAYKEDKRPTPPSASPEDEVMARVASGEVPLVVEAHRAPEIRALLDMLRAHPRVRLVLAGATEAAPLASALAERSAAVIVFPTPLGTGRPSGWTEHDLGLAGVLDAAGVRVLIGSGGSRAGASDLALMAGLAVGHGLDREAAFAALTLAAAETFDVADRIGSVEVGKQADLLLLKGDPLSPAARVQYVLVGGQIVLEPEAR
ncbi:MAG: amidohydrolase family protein [Planctomycetes bacterium]|nr:amidohydrolase family protein [Planctomycetota bacterium]